MATSLTRWWIHKTKKEAETYTTAEVFALLLAADKGEYCLSCLRRIMADVLDLESRAAELSVQIQNEKGRQPACQELKTSGGGNFKLHHYRRRDVQGCGSICPFPPCAVLRPCYRRWSAW
jgi:hypothetical protein